MGEERADEGGRDGRMRDWKGEKGGREGMRGMREMGLARASFIFAFCVEF